MRTTASLISRQRKTGRPRWPIIRDTWKAIATVSMRFAPAIWGSAANVNIITCTRLKGLIDGTDGLRSHASVPLYEHGKRLGVLNVVSSDWHELSAENLRPLYSVVCARLENDKTLRLRLRHTSGLVEGTLIIIISRTLKRRYRWDVQHAV